MYVHKIRYEWYGYDMVSVDVSLGCTTLKGISEEGSQAVPGLGTVSLCNSLEYFLGGFLICSALSSTRVLSLVWSLS